MSSKNRKPKNLYAGTKAVKTLNGLKDFQLLNRGNGYEVQFTNPMFTGKNGIVLFYADWCPHCVNMTEDMIQFAERVQNVFPVGALNAADKDNSEIAKYYGVTGYPTIKYLDGGMFKDYTGGKTTKELLQFVCAVSGLCNL